MLPQHKESKLIDQKVWDNDIRVVGDEQIARVRNLNVAEWRATRTLLSRTRHELTWSSSKSCHRPLYQCYLYLSNLLLLGPIQAALNSVTERTPYRHIFSGLGRLVIIKPALCFRVLIVNPPGATRSLQVSTAYDCWSAKVQSHDGITFNHATFHAVSEGPLCLPQHGTGEVVSLSGSFGGSCWWRGYTTPHSPSPTPRCWLVHSPDAFLPHNSCTCG